MECERERQGIDRVFPLRLPSPPVSGLGREPLRHPRVDLVRSQDFFAKAI